MRIEFDHTNLLAQMVGESNGVSKQEVRDLLPRAIEALHSFRKLSEAGTYGFAHLPFQTATISSIEKYATSVRGSYDTVCLVGIGGSALGAWYAFVPDKMTGAFKIAVGTGNTAGKVVVGIRPEDIAISERPEPGAVEFSAYSILPSGADSTIVARLGRLNPPPVRRPLPILIGGGGEKVTLRLVARYASMWNIIAEPADAKRKNDLLTGYCKALGRDPAEVERTVILLGGDPLEKLPAYIDAGLTHLRNLQRLESLDTAGTRVTAEGLRQLKARLPLLQDE